MIFHANGKLGKNFLLLSGLLKIWWSLSAQIYGQLMHRQTRSKKTLTSFWQKVPYHIHEINIQ